MNLIKNLTDIYVFLTLTVPIILTLTISNDSVLALSTIIVSKVLLSITTFNRKKWKSRMNWFEISKLLGGLAGIITITYYRYCSFYSHTIIVMILGINMLEAILSDLIRGGYYNAAAGVLLLCKVPFAMSDQSILQKLPTYNLFLFPLSYNWILCYTTWNAAFSYGFNYSLSTRLILLSSIIVSYILQQHDVWLGARTYGLVINMILRSMEMSYLYIPDKSIITTNNNRHNPYVRILWGLCNFIIVFMFLHKK